MTAETVHLLKTRPPTLREQLEERTSATARMLAEMKAMQIKPPGV